MRNEFRAHNLFRSGIDLFANHDPHLSRLGEMKFVYTSEMESGIPLHIPGIYILTGGRQVGKSTLMKKIIRQLLRARKCRPDHIFYIAGDIIFSYQELLSEIQRFAETLGPEDRFYLFIDEITYVKDWDRAIKYLADTGLFRKGSVLLSGSDTMMLKDSMKRFPGRRGQADKTDFHYHPLSFFEYVNLLKPGLLTTRPELPHIHESPLGHDAAAAGKINALFEQYLTTGGFLTALNDFADGAITTATYQTYAQWIAGDILKNGKSEVTLRELVRSLAARLTNQISCQNLVAATSIQHHQTVQDYLDLLERMDVIFIQSALREHKLSAAPKKARKIHFCDPFIYQSIYGWAEDIEKPWEYFQTQLAADQQLKSRLAEGCVSALFARRHDVYYIKAQAEVDLAVVRGSSFIPVEIKWTKTLREPELKQIVKYRNGIIGYNGTGVGEYKGLKVIPVSLIALCA